MTFERLLDRRREIAEAVQVTVSKDTADLRCRDIHPCPVIRVSQQQVGHRVPDSDGHAVRARREIRKHREQPGA
jgi:hypothetical protein